MEQVFPKRYSRKKGVRGGAPPPPPPLFSGDYLLVFKIRDLAFGKQIYWQTAQC